MEENGKTEVVVHRAGGEERRDVGVLGAQPAGFPVREHKHLERASSTATGVVSPVHAKQVTCSNTRAPTPALHSTSCNPIRYMHV